MSKQILIPIILSLLLTGCFALPIEEEFLPPPTIEMPDPRPVRTVLATRGDVIFSTEPPTSYLPLRQEILRFNVANQRIRGVFVEAGDQVSQGDILAELDRPAIWTQLEDARWDEELAMMQISHLNERREFSLNQAMSTGVPVDDLHYVEEMERLQGQLGLVRMRLDYLNREAESVIIRAPFDGVVVFTMDFSGVMWSNLEQAVVTIADHGDYIFRLLGFDAHLIEEGKTYEISVNGETFLSEAINPEAEGIARPAQIGDTEAEGFFRIIGDERPTIATPMMSFVTIIHYSATNVIMLPNHAVNTVGDRVFVYVLENDVTVVRDIEIGLVGNLMSEITHGLEEGEVVVFGEVFAGFAG